MSHTTAFIAELIRAVNEAKGLRRKRSAGCWITRLTQSVICADRLASLPATAPGPAGTALARQEDSSRAMRQSQKRTWKARGSLTCH